jgi:hypothetical protein
MTDIPNIDIVLETLALLMTGLLSGVLLSMAILIFFSGKFIPQAEVIRKGASLFFWLSSILSLIAAFSSALTGHGVGGFLLGIIAMSLIFSRIHLLRLAINSWDEAQGGDAGAMRMYRLNMGLLAALLCCQILASLWVLVLLAERL